MAYVGYAAACRWVEPSWGDLNQRYSLSHLPQVDIYADGAALANGRYDAVAGWGLHFEPPWVHLSSGGRVMGCQTNQRAELTAIYQAIVRAPAGWHVVIHTDSQYAINCLTRWLVRWEANGFHNIQGHEVVNRDVIQNIMLVRRQRPTRVFLTYVAAHTGIPGNERADMIAKDAAMGHWG